MSSSRPPGGTARQPPSCSFSWNRRGSLAACWTRPRLGRGADRGEEIAAWLAEHAVSGYVIIDDHVDMGELGTHLVQTHPAHGLQAADATRAIATLMRPLTGGSHADRRFPDPPLAERQDERAASPDPDLFGR